MSDQNLVTLGHFETTHKMRRYIDQVLTTGRLSYGVLCGEFEARFALLHNSLYGVLSNSGTSSLQVALQALKIRHNWPVWSEVLIPASTFVATANVCYHNDLIPVPVDIDSEYYCIDPGEIEAKITKSTVAIMPVHLFGHPADMKRIRQIADSYNLSIVEDSCECMFVSDNDISVGSWGEVGVFSFYMGHILPIGVGGIGITRDEDLAKLMRSLVNHGISLTELPAGSPYDPTFLARKFEFIHRGHSFRITEMEAALGLAQLDDWGTMMDRRAHNAEYLTENLKPLSDMGLLQLPSIRKDADHAWMVYPILVLKQPKQPLRRTLQNAGIECRDAMPLTNQPCYDFDENAYPNAKFLNRHGLYIGCHQGLTKLQLDYTLENIYKHFDQ